MILADVNVLIYAFRPDAPRHDVCKSWLETAVYADARYGVSPLALAALVRIATNPRAYRQPTPLVEAFAFCDSLLRRRNAVTVEPGERHWAILRKLVDEGQAIGPLVMDAALAAIALEHGATLCTTDRDFSRFTGLKWLNPLVSGN